MRNVFCPTPNCQTFRPKVVTSIAMFYDLEEPRKFVADIQASYASGRCLDHADELSAAHAQAE